MDAPRKVIVGYDLCEDFTQISCYSYKTSEPIAISLREGEENSRIPTVLCLKADTKQWVFGEEAEACAKSGAGILVDHLLTKVQKKEEVELFQTKFTAAALMEKFLRKSLTLIKNYFPSEPITKLVLTVKNTEPDFVDQIYKALALLGIEKDRAVVMSHSGAYLYYALYQEKALWVNDVGLFDFSEEGLCFYQLRMNRRSKPMIAGLSKQDYSSQLNSNIRKQNNSNAAYIFGNIAETALYKQLVTTLYFTGSGFDGGWADQAIKNLCAGRRVFYGQNLFTKGACFAAKELSGDKQLGDILLLNDDMAISTVSVRVYCDTKYTEVPLLEAGETWYEVNRSIEVIPEGCAELELAVNNMMTRDLIRETLPLDRITVRQDRTSRLRINFTCRDKAHGIIRITDLGFGELYPETGNQMEYTIEIG